MAVTEVNFAKAADSGWGFRLTGGPRFGMPLTVFEVEESGRAFGAGVRLGDVLVRINGMDADRLSLEDAGEMIRAAGDNINLSISNADDQELLESEELAKALALSASELEDTEEQLSHELRSEASEIETSEILHSETAESELPHSETAESELPHSEATESEVYRTDSEAAKTDSANALKEADATSISSDMSKSSASSKVSKSSTKGQPNVEEEEEQQFVDVNSLPLRPPRPAPEPEKAVRKCWHPVMLDADTLSSDKSSFSFDVAKFIAKNQAKMQEEEEEEEQFVDVNSLPLLPPRPAPEPGKAARKCWHPVMLDTNPPPIIEESTGDAEYPHKKTIRLLKQMIAEKKVTPTPETLIFFLCNKFAVSEERANKISL